MKRKAFLTLIVGSNGTGKTTWLKNNIINKSKNCLIVTPDPIEYREYETIEKNENFQRNIYFNEGIKRVIWDNNLEEILKNVHNCTLILDDIKTVLSNVTPLFLNKLYIRRRQKMIDIYFVAHSLMQLPPAIFEYSNYLIYFKTNENIIKRKKDISDINFVKIEKANKKLQSAPPFTPVIIPLLQ